MTTIPNKTTYPNSISNQVLSFSLNKFYFFELLKILLNVYRNRISFDELKVINLFALTEGDIKLREINEYCDLDNFLNTTDDRVFGEFIFQNVRYFVNFLRYKIRYQGETLQLEYIVNFNFNAHETPSENIMNELLEYSFRSCSSFKKGCLELVHNHHSVEDINYLEVKKIVPPKSCLDNILIDDRIKSEINRFIYSFENFQTLKTPLRYMLSGKPGLGKTEIVRSIINKCSSHGIVIISKEQSCSINMIFDFACLFSPCIVCIDDLDLTLGSRDDKYNPYLLGEFLNKLDGIIQNRVFLLATTNDKKLVDVAASRPGRFDAIIDFGDFERKNYLPLLLQKTDDERILSLFQDEVLDLLESKKVTGAFIVNIIKQIKILIDINPEFSIKDLLDFITRSHSGFYKSQLKKEVTFGFRNETPIE